MNVDHLGDALDHWKGSLLEFLQRESVLRQLAVDPMATDRERWNEAALALYARLLHIDRRRIISHEARLAARDSYFAEIVHDGDLFLDPDTGFATSRVSPITKYVKPNEVAALLRSPGRRVVAVYQHIRAQKTCVRVDACAAAVAEEIDTGGWCSYESPTVAMLFLCGDVTRTAEIGRTFRGLLGGHAKGKIRSGTLKRRASRASA